MKPLLRSLLGLLLMLVIGFQPVAGIQSGQQSDQAIWQHWQYHAEHDSHAHADSASQLDHGGGLEERLHAEACHAGHSLYVVDLYLPGSHRLPSAPIINPPEQHNAPILSVDTPPPIV